MKRPESNGLFAMAGNDRADPGFACMKLAEFLTAEGVTGWKEWHGAHMSAQSGKCIYVERCPIYKKTKNRSMSQPNVNTGL